MSDIIPEGILYGNLGVGSGTTNYNDLDNKPQINSVTLQGNKTASELGLVGTADIPVTSVNGEKGAVVLDGTEIEFSDGVSLNEKIIAVEQEIPVIAYPVTSVNGETGAVVLDGTDINYQAGKTINQKIDEVEAEIPVVSYPVTSVNGETGAVVLDGTDIEYSSGVSVNSQIDTLMQYIPVYNNTASGAIATFDTSLSLPLQDCTIEINGSGATGAYIGYCDFNQLQVNTKTVTVNGVTFTYNNGSLNIKTTEGGATGNAFWLSSSDNKWNFIINHIYFMDVDNANYSYTTGDKVRWYVPTSPSMTLSRPQQMFRCSVNDSQYMQIRVDQGAELNETYMPQCYDLTSMFGSTIAEYLFNLETETQGAGIAKFKQLFPNDYYSYNAGGTKVTVDSVNGTPTCPNAHVSWQTEAGTVYEGSLNVTTGKLTVVNGSMGAGEYQITPIPINQLRGNNLIFCDTDGDTSVVYACSLKDYIDSQ